MKIVFRTYTQKDGSPEDGYYAIMQYLEGLKEKDLLVRIDYNKKNEFALDEVDFFFPSLKISKLALKPLSDGKFEASFETKDRRAVFALFVTLAGTGNGGHSFELCIGKKVFYIDGDGADHLESINGVKMRGEILDKRYKWPEVYNKDEETESNTIQLSESRLKGIIKECVIKVLAENE